MPWLIKDKDKQSENLFFVHVPRCGGTSLMKSHDIPNKSMTNCPFYKTIGMKIFFHRYKLLESANFPIVNTGNAILLLIFLYSWMNYSNTMIGKFIMAFTFMLFLGLSFVFTAPTIGRLTYVRRSFLILIHDFLFRFMESIEWCTGTNNKGYINHLTAHKLLHYGYIPSDVWYNTSTMAIVRNPYSRMVSVYMYNRFGPMESFEHFVKTWGTTMKHYQERGEMEEWYTPCHCLPQFEYTHFKGKQLVQSIVKQEELKYLKYKEDESKAIAQDSSIKDLPIPVKDALLGMPHDNKRKTSKKWYEYYNQETLNITYELYHHDFAIFGYSPKIDQRPDLVSPVPTEIKPDVDKLMRNSLNVQQERKSLLMLSASMSCGRSSMRGPSMKSAKFASLLSTLESDSDEKDDLDSDEKDDLLDSYQQSDLLDIDEKIEFLDSDK